MHEDNEAQVIDARGHRCPTPTLKLRRAAAKAGPSAQLKLICDDPMARIDVPHFAKEAGLDILETLENEGVLTFIIATRRRQEARRVAGGNDAPPGLSPDR